MSAVALDRGDDRLSTTTASAACSALRQFWGLTPIITPAEIVGIAYDSGGVTTSTVTVPVVTASGVRHQIRVLAPRVEDEQ